MMTRRRSIPRCGRYALFGVVTLVCVGCASIAGPWFTRTPPDSTSQIFPSVATGCRCASAPVAANWFERVLIVVLENQDQATAIRDPYLHKLAMRGAHFTNFHGLFHPSYSNYLAMVTGKEVATVFDRQQDLDECTIADLLSAKGLGWKNYAEGYPDNPPHCVTDHAFDRYARKHVPFMSFKSVQRNACDNVVAAGRFDRDRAGLALPAYAFYTPDMDDDGHDQGLAYASRWLERFLEPLLDDRAFMRGTLIVVTFDESADQSPGSDNHIYTVFLGPMVKPGELTGNYNHYNVLRTIEENFGLCTLGDGDAAARPIVNVWR